jgi:hypothetical protein
MNVFLSMRNDNAASVCLTCRLSTRRTVPVSVRIIRHVGALTVVAASLIGCGGSGDDESSTDASTAETSSSTEAPAVTTDTPAPRTEAPSSSTEVQPVGGTATCDEASVAQGIGDDVAAIVNLECDDGWAAAYYTDNEGLSRPAILRAEGQFWILQDWYAVCEGDPTIPGDIALPESLRQSCPGG